MTADELDDLPPPAAPKPASGWWLLGPVLAFTLAAVTLVGLVIGIAVAEIDRTAIAGSQRLADSALRMLRRDVALWVKDYAFWDAAVENLNASPDPDWVAGNVGQYVIEAFGATATLAIDPEDRVLYLAYDPLRGEPPPGFAEMAVTALEPLIAEARAAPLAEPVGVSGFFDLDGALMLAGAAAMTPQRPTAEQLLPHSRPVLIFVRQIDEAVFADLQERFNLPDLRLVRSTASVSPHAYPIAGPKGDPIGWIDWLPTRPGGVLLDRVAWPLAGVGLALLALAWLVLRRVQKTNRNLREQAEALRRANDEHTANMARVRSALQRAEHATRAKSSFLAGISHELRTPLTAIIGFSQILKIQHRPGKTRNREQEYAEIIHDSSQQLLNLVNGILDLAKIESGGYDLEESWIDLAREVRSVRSLLAHDAERRGVAVDAELPTVLPALYGDSKGVRQIILNLLSNALKFTDRGGWARLTVRVDPEGGLVIEVADSGSGIAPDDRKHIWEAFKRARNNNLTSAEGSGLGLHLVKVMATLHGADVGLDSEIGKGTRVWVAFGPERVRVLAA